MRDLTPVLEEFITFDGKCALCEQYSSYSRWCFIKGETVRNDGTCEKFKERMRR